jgi:Tfp pilus assembly protein PilX
MTHQSLQFPRRGRQRGATLIVGLIMLVLLTLIVVGGFTLSSSNLKTVGNVQVRDESVAAANQVIETLISTSSTPFYNRTGSVTFTVDINKDTTADYSVEVAAPLCVSARQASESAPSDVELPVAMQSGAEWNTDWDIDAKVSDLRGSGATATVREGVRVRLSQAQKTAVCSQPANRRSP